MYIARQIIFLFKIHDDERYVREICLNFVQANKKDSLIFWKRKKYIINNHPDISKLTHKFKTSVKFKLLAI